MNQQTSRLTSALAREEDKLLACIHCGLCLEACPTYVHTGDENDSPRGRIYLMRAVEEERLTVSSSAFERHINRCLGCRACEQACPAGVEYGQLLEAARASIWQSGAKRSHASRLLHFILTYIWLHPTRLRLALAATRLVRDSGFSRLLLWAGAGRLISPRINLALALLDSSSATSLGEAPAAKDNPPESVRLQPRGERAPHEEKEAASLLFTGCVMESLFTRVNQATARVLTANGCVIGTPQDQVCCGALHAHAGDLAGARALARRNIEAFDDAADHTSIVTNAGGCGAMLASYGHLLEDDPEYAERAWAFSRRVRDISQQLQKTDLRPGAKLGDEKVTYDASCHLLYGQGAAQAPIEMLLAIPDLKLVPLEGSERCCGGAGVYNLLETDLSARVLTEKLEHIKETGAEILATGNPGCHMQIAAGAHLTDLPLRVCHPVELLDEAYRRAGFYDEAGRL